MKQLFLKTTLSSSNEKRAAICQMAEADLNRLAVEALHQEVNCICEVLAQKYTV